MSKIWKHKTATGPWASEVEYLHKKAQAEAQRHKQKLGLAGLKAASEAALAAPGGVDIGEGTLADAVSTLDMLRALNRSGMGKPGERRELLRKVLGLAQAVLAEREESVRQIQDACRSLGDGSLVAESDGTEIVRMRTEKVVHLGN